MDLQMPEMDGVTAVQKLRETSPASEQPYIVALTANAQREDADRCFAVGMHDFVTKPTRFETLKQALERAHRWLSERGLAATVSADERLV
jgi:CheY-like chemotaxis protein